MLLVLTYNLQFLEVENMTEMLLYILWNINTGLLFKF